MVARMVFLVIFMATAQALGFCSENVTVSAITSKWHAQQTLPESVRAFVSGLLTTYLSDPELVAACVAQNNEGLSMNDIAARDADWIAKTSAGLLLQQTVYNHSVSQKLRQEIASRPEVAEAFLMDAQGANVAVSDITSDYYQGDEDKWRDGFNYCRGGFGVGALTIDKSSQKLAMHISFPILALNAGDDSQGQLVGALNMAIYPREIRAEPCQVPVHFSTIENMLLSSTGLTANLAQTLRTAILPYTVDPLLQACVDAQNSRDLSLEWVLDQDAAWQDAPADNLTAFQTELLNNTCSRYLLSIKESLGAGWIAEVFVMDNLGGLVGSAVLTSDYYQGDESKWQRAYNGCQGGVFADAEKIDVSTNKRQQQISLPILSGDRVVGAITWGIVLREKNMRCVKPVELAYLLTQNKIQDQLYVQERLIEVLVESLSGEDTFGLALEESNSNRASNADLAMRNQIWQMGGGESFLDPTSSARLSVLVTPFGRAVSSIALIDLAGGLVAAAGEDRTELYDWRSSVAFADVRNDCSGKLVVWETISDKVQVYFPAMTQDGVLAGVLAAVLVPEMMSASNQTYCVTPVADEALGNWLQEDAQLTNTMQKTVERVLMEFSRDSVLLDFVRKQNAERQTMGAVWALDEAWIQASKSKAGTTSHQLQVLNSAPSQRLLELLTTINLSIVTEVFLMDNLGALVATSAITSDYWQGDEAKWQRSFNGCQGGVHVSLPAFDQSTNSDQRQVSFPLRDPATNYVIGAATFGISSRDIEPDCTTPISLQDLTTKLGGFSDSLTYPTRHRLSTLLVSLPVDEALWNGMTIGSQTVNWADKNVREELWRLDSAQVNWTGANVDWVRQEVYQSPLSQYLLELQGSVAFQGLSVLGLDVLGSSGALVASTVPLPRFWYGDEVQFITAWGSCGGSVFLSNAKASNIQLLRDSTAGSNQLLKDSTRISFPILNPATNTAAGVMEIFFRPDRTDYLGCKGASNTRSYEEIRSLVDSLSLPFVLKEKILGQIVPEVRARQIFKQALASDEAQTHTLEWVLQEDMLWKKAMKSESKPTATMSRVYNSPASLALRQMQAEIGDWFVKEVFLQDLQGAVVGISEWTSDYYQGDEAKYINAFRDCQGGIELEPLEWDESAKSNLYFISLPMFDEQGVMIGILSWGLTDGIEFVQPNQSAMVAVQVVAALVCFILVLAVYVMLRFRHHPVFKISSVPFRAIIIFGSLLIVCSAFSATVPVSDSSCSASLWLLQQGFALSMGTMALITYRIYTIMKFAKKSLRRARMPNSFLFTFMLIVLAVNTVFLALWQVFNPPRAILYVSDRVRFFTCQFGTQPFFMVILLILDILVIVSCVIVAWQIQKVILRGFRYASDMKEIFVASYNIALLCCVFLPVLSELRGNPTVAQLFLAVFGILLGACLFVCIFAHRFTMLIRFPDPEEYMRNVSEASDGYTGSSNNQSMQASYFRNMTDEQLLEWLQKESLPTLLQALRGNLHWEQNGSLVSYHMKSPSIPSKYTHTNTAIQTLKSGVETQSHAPKLDSGVETKSRVRKLESLESTAIVAARCTLCDCTCFSAVAKQDAVAAPKVECKCGHSQMLHSDTYKKSSRAVMSVPSKNFSYNKGNHSRSSVIFASKYDSTANHDMEIDFEPDEYMAGDEDAFTQISPGHPGLADMQAQIHTSFPASNPGEQQGQISGPPLLEEAEDKESERPTIDPREQQVDRPSLEQAGGKESDHLRKQQVQARCSEPFGGTLGAPQKAWRSCSAPSAGVAKGPVAVHMVSPKNARALTYHVEASAEGDSESETRARKHSRNWSASESETRASKNSRNRSGSQARLRQQSQASGDQVHIAATKDTLENEANDSDDLGQA